MILLPWMRMTMVSGARIIEKQRRSLVFLYLMSTSDTSKEYILLMKCVNILSIFERHTLLNKLAARRKFYTTTMLGDERILSCTNRIRQFSSTEKSMGVEIEEHTSVFGRRTHSSKIHVSQGKIALKSPTTQIVRIKALNTLSVIAVIFPGFIHHTSLNTSSLAAILNH